MSSDLLDWLNNNKMCFNILDEDVIEIIGFGKMYYEDTGMIKSIFVPMQTITLNSTQWKIFKRCKMRA